MRTRPTITLWSRFAGWVLLLVYLAVIPGLVAASVQTVAALHGSHEVSITAAHGDWDVVLHHREDGRSHGHEHSPPGESAAAVVDDDNHHHGPDHVFHFSTALHATAPVPGDVPGVVPDSLMPDRIFAPERAACSVPNCLETVFARPPPGRPALLVCLRTTVLIV